MLFAAGLVALQQSECLIMLNKTLIWDVLLITALAAILYSLFAGSYPLITPDEGRYIEVAREMVASGNFITPHLNGAAFLDKPILFYWLEAGLIKVFGLHEWVVRLLPAFFAWFGCLLSYWAGTALYNRRTGLLAALMQMTMLLYFLLAHYCDMDLMVAVLLSAVLWLFLVGLQKLQSRYFWLAYFFAGLAFLTKGLMAIVFPAMIVGAWILVLSRWRTLKKIHLISGLLIFVAVVAPWFILVQKQNPEFLNYFFVVQQFSRYLTPNFNSHQPFYFYIVVILLGIFPWVLFLFQSLRFAAKKIQDNFQAANKEIFMLLWILLIFIFFSIPKSKIVGYIMPVFPPLAMLIAYYLDTQWSNLPKARAKKSRIIFISLLVAMLAFEIAAAATVKKISVMQQNSYIKQLSAELRPTLGVNDRLVMFNVYYQDVPLYFQQTLYVVANWDAKDVLLHDNWRRELAEDLLYKKHARRNLLIGYQELKTMWADGQQRIFIIAPEKEEQNLKQLLAPPIYVLQQQAGLIVLSNRRKSD